MSRSDSKGLLFWRRLFKQFESKGSTLQSRLRDAITSAIVDESIQPGDAVPSSRWFAESFGISRTTTSLVLQRLCDAGLLIARERSGYAVNPDLVSTQVPGDGPRATGDAVRPGRAKPSSQTASRLALQRNIVKPPDWQRYPFPFIYGQFDPMLFPFADWRECVIESLGKGEVAQWAPDHIDRDSELLVEQIRLRLLPSRGIWAEAENILVTAGAQQATYMLAALLFQRTTRVGIEDPGYPDARNTFALHSDQVVALPVDSGGLIVDASLNRCRYVYVTPSHQCPTTVTMNLERRNALLERATRHDFMIIEDDHETELNHFGKPTPALRSLDGGNRVIYIGSLSKTLAHGLRIGYVVAPAPLIRELRALRRLMLRHPPTNNEHVAAIFIRHGMHEALVRRLNRNYRDRAKVLNDALTRHWPEASHAPASGGSAMWVQLPPAANTTDLARRALAEGVVIEPGEVFFSDADAPRCFIRLGYSSIESGRIEEGIKALVRVARDTI